MIQCDGLPHATLDPVVQQSLAYWAAAGVDPHRLDALTQVDVQIADLSKSLLGIAALNVVWIDRDAAGYGWSVNSGGVDLFSAVTHEFGHVLGYEHNHAAGLMNPTLLAGRSLLPGRNLFELAGSDGDSLENVVQTALTNIHQTRSRTCVPLCFRHHLGSGACS